MINVVTKFNHCSRQWKWLGRYNWLGERLQSISTLVLDRPIHSFYCFILYSNLTWPGLRSALTVHLKALRAAEWLLATIFVFSKPWNRQSTKPSPSQLEKMVFIRLKKQQLIERKEKGKCEEEAGTSSYQPHIVEHSISLLLKNLRK